MPRGQHPNSLANLKRGKKTQFNGETAAKAGKKGAEVTAEVRRAKKTFRQLFEEALEMEIEKKDITGKVVEKKTAKEVIAVQQIKKAMSGDNRAVEFIRDTIGEKPTDTLVIAGISDDIMKEVDELVNSHSGD